MPGVVGAMAARARLTWRLTVGRAENILVISRPPSTSSYGAAVDRDWRTPPSPRRRHRLVVHLQRQQRYLICGSRRGAGRTYGDRRRMNRL